MPLLPVTSARLADLLPAGAATAAVAFAPPDAERLADLFPGVAIPAELSAAVPVRRLHYAAGRHCARVTLSRLGIDRDAELMRDRHGVPVWPAGIRGCISHTGDLAWAAAMRSAGARGLGIDVERIASVERARIEHLVCGPPERRAGEESGLPSAAFLTLAFSFKESIFKCLFPLVRTFFDYRDATLTAVDPGGRTVEARLERRLGFDFPAGTTLTGRFALSTTHVFTTVHVPRSDARVGRDGGLEAPLAAEPDADLPDGELRTTDHGPRTTA